MGDARLNAPAAATATRARLQGLAVQVKLEAQGLDTQLRADPTSFAFRGARTTIAALRRRLDAIEGALPAPPPSPETTREPFDDGWGPSDPPPGHVVDGRGLAECR